MIHFITVILDTSDKTIILPKAVNNISSICLFKSYNHPAQPCVILSDIVAPQIYNQQLLPVLGYTPVGKVERKALRLNSFDTVSFSVRQLTADLEETELAKALTIVLKLDCDGAD